MRPHPGVVALLLLAGCEGHAATSTNTLRLALINDPILNPVLSPDVGSVLVNKVIFPGLVRPDEELRPSPDLATSWTVSDDGKVYTFALRRGVKWHDGAPFTSRDVQYTFEQIRDPKAGGFLWSDYTAIDRVEVPDSFTVRFVLKTPFAAFLTLLGYNSGIIPEHAFGGKPIDVNIGGIGVTEGLRSRTTRRSIAGSRSAPDRSGWWARYPARRSRSRRIPITMAPGRSSPGSSSSWCPTPTPRSPRCAPGSSTW